MRLICSALLALTVLTLPACAGQHDVSTPGGSFTMPVSADDVRRAAIRLADETRAAVNLTREVRALAQTLGLPATVMDRIDGTALAFFRAAEELGTKLADRTERAALVADSQVLGGLIDRVFDALSQTGNTRLDRWVEMIQAAWVIGRRLVGLDPIAPFATVFVEVAHEG